MKRVVAAASLLYLFPMVSLSIALASIPIIMVVLNLMNDALGMMLIDGGRSVYLLHPLFYH